MKLTLLLFIPFIFIACSTANVEETEVSFTQEIETIKIENNGPFDVKYMLFDSRTAATIYITYSCKNFEPNLNSGITKVISFDEISGYDNDAESFWYTWTDCRTNGDSGYITINKLTTSE